MKQVLVFSTICCVGGLFGAQGPAQPQEQQTIYRKGNTFYLAKNVGSALSAYFIYEAEKEMEETVLSAFNDCPTDLPKPGILEVAEQYFAGFRIVAKSGEEVFSRSHTKWVFYPDADKGLLANYPRLQTMYRCFFNQRVRSQSNQCILYKIILRAGTIDDESQSSFFLHTDSCVNLMCDNSNGFMKVTWESNRHAIDDMIQTKNLSGFESYPVQGAIELDPKPE